MSKYFPLRVKEVRRETDQCVSVAFDIPEDLRETFKYIHGQHISVKCRINGEDIRRSYSICSAPSENALRVAVKKVRKGKFSTYANEDLAAGDTLEVFPPQGHFYTVPEPALKNTYVFFAAGSGITPVISNIKTLLTTEPESTCLLFYGNRATDTIIFREELENMKNRYMDRFALHHILSREMQESALFTGRIDGEKCRHFSGIFFDPQEVRAFFLCGPEEMIFDLRTCLQELGVKEEAIHYELFTTPATKSRPTYREPEEVAFADDQAAEVSMILDGIKAQYRVPYRGKNILDAAIQSGADVPYACKGGVCTTCKAKLLEGDVKMDVNYGLEPDELEAGFILTCQAHPRSEKLTIDFDIR